MGQVSIQLIEKSIEIKNLFKNAQINFSNLSIFFFINSIKFFT